jgi:transglutaminase/protease-like cytokinesis protein 3
MSRGLKALTVILLVAVITVIGLIIISKTGFMSEENEVRDYSVKQDDDVKISTETEEAGGPTFETPVISATTDPVISETSTPSATPTATATVEPKTTAVPIPETPQSSSDEPQIITSTSMNGYIYVSYKSDKKVKVMMNLGDSQEVYDLIGDGQFHRFTLHLGDGNYKIRLVENTTGNSYRVVMTEEFDCVMINENFPYLVPNSFVVYDNDMEVIQFGLELTEDSETDEEKAHALYDWIVRNISYDFSVLGKLSVGYVPDPQTTYETKKGICSDFAALFASLCRSQGIPCKVVLGYYAKSDYYHAWNEVYINGEYVIVDASGDSQTGNYNFSRTEGYTTNKEN